MHFMMESMFKLIVNITKDESIFKSGDIFYIDCQKAIDELVSKLFTKYPSPTYNSSYCAKCSSKNFVSSYLKTTLNNMKNLQLSIESGLYEDYICYR